jgi:ATP-dependent DNA helicase RecQ
LKTFGRGCLVIYAGFAGWVAQCLQANEDHESEKCLLEGYAPGGPISEEELWRTNCVRRCISALLCREIQEFASGTQIGPNQGLVEKYHPGRQDGLALLRQVSLLTGKTVKLPLPNKLPFDLPSGLQLWGLRIFDGEEGKTYFNADHWPSSLKQPRFGEDVTDLFSPRAVKRRAFNHEAADGVLLAYTKFDRYQSRTQKRAIHAILTAPKRSIILVSLPTGSGKSLLCQLPSLYWTKAGESPVGKLSILVCPTVALVEDQFLSTSELFGSQKGQVFKVTGDTPAIQRDHVLQRVRSGNGAVCIMTPEALLGYAQEAVNNAAQDGNINMLIVDEVHLIDSWGAKFRPAIQRIANLRRQLVDCSEKVITLLLSATIKPTTRERVENLYSNNDDCFQFFDGSDFRVEHDFLRTRVKSDQSRRDLIHDALRILPRPLIIYTTTVEDADSYYDELSNEGYARIRIFTGKTKWRERETIIREWRNDHIDIVVATSAFGLGIDKQNVRAIIHATLPESLDRLYQEIGRGGRDGFPCLSWIITTPADLSTARGNALGELLTPPLIVLRWLAMLEDAEGVDIPGDTAVRLDLNARTEDVKRQSPKSGRTNLEWNQGVLLILERAGVIEAVDQVPVPKNDQMGMIFKILNLDMLIPGKTDKTRFRERLEAFIEPTREREQEVNKLGLNRVDQWSGGNENSCASEMLREVYYFPSSQSCGRCWYCRSIGITPSLTLSTIEKFKSIDLPPQKKITLNAGLSTRIGCRSRIGLIEYEPDKYSENIAPNLRSLISRLAEDGVQQFFCPRSYMQMVAGALKNERSSIGLTIPIDDLLSDALLVKRLEYLPSVVIAGDEQTSMAEGKKFWDAAESFDCLLTPHTRLILVVPRGFSNAPSHQALLADRLNIKQVVSAIQYIGSLD